MIILAYNAGNIIENSFKIMNAIFLYTRNKQYSHFLNLLIRIKKFLVYCVVMGFFIVAIGHAQKAVSENTYLPESVLDSISNSGINAASGITRIFNPCSNSR